VGGVEVVMDVDLVKSLFAVYVVVVSLLRLMSDHEFFRLTAMKKVWGRSQGLMIHFVVNVILPLLMAIFYLCRSITNPLTF
jgi:hypothetical protein